MDIVINGEPRSVAAGTTLQALLEAEGLAGRRVAVEVNGEIVPRGRHAGHALAAGDRVEIVHALGGG
ncbi:sulfur carrier protein ThiS [Pseudoxanthomonas suwonensis]|jgi:thiamine biosynthesis protein ThiS|uniref:sulfur carrier protein ThiS n=1 Tax=Pseudoxanthomonas suwonensis TaxID=314722 RepID=UPI000467CDA4|nr:sulfur carrier protein ThiS [Pseudoxanthomonas suwonensis]